MGTRSDKRKFRRRRQRAGFVLLVSLIIEGGLERARTHIKGAEAFAKKYHPY
jgi:hypothetical protein